MTPNVAKVFAYRDSYIHDPVWQLALRHAERLDALEAENERLRMQLAACGVVAMANTPESAGKTRDMLPEYRSASCDDVARAVDREMDLRAELAMARNDALLNEQDAVRWRKFVSFDCLALHLPILRANSVETRNSTADAMDRLIDAIDCEPVIRALKREGGGND